LLSAVFLLVALGYFGMGVFSGKPLQTFLFPSVFFFSFFLLFLVIGIIGEYINIIYQEVKKRPFSNVKNIVDSDQLS